MKVLFMRHGESKSQAKEISPTAPDPENGLTDVGIQQIANTAHNFRGNLDTVYASPYNRTQLTARIFLDDLGIKKNIIPDNRLREINYGKHGTEKKNDPDLVDVAIKQIAGDYEVRFGKTGENKREIVTRFFDFLVDVFNTHPSTDTILAVSHGRAISIAVGEFCTINNIPVDYSGTKNAQIKEIELTANKIEKIIQHIEKINLK